MSPPVQTRDELVVQIVEICHLLAARGMVAATDGNVSARLSPDSILITRSGVNKGMVGPGDIVEIDASGRLRSGEGKPSTEAGLHLCIYARRPDVAAVVHAHPVHATGFAAARVVLDHTVLPEAAVGLGPVPLAPYATPSTPEVAASIEPFIGTADAILLANHGVVTCGPSLLEAWFRMETVEHVAAVLFVARALGGECRLSSSELERLAAVSPASYGKELHR